MFKYLSNFAKKNNMTYRDMSNDHEFTFALGYFIDRDPSSENYEQYENRVAGFSINKLNKELKNLYVMPKYQGKGIARLLVEYAKEMGAVNLIAEEKGVGLSRDQLISFFERHNFVQKKGSLMVLKTELYPGNN